MNSSHTLELRPEAPVAVFGLGVSGVSAVRLLVALGARVEAYDAKPIAALSAAAREVLALSEVQFGGPIPAAGAWPLVVLSPGVPLSAPAVEAARAAGAEVLGELELAWRLLQQQQPCIAITGTNGKSTTTDFTGQLLKAVGRRPFVGGNLGRPLSEALLEDETWDTLVVEASSYQLEHCRDFRPDVAVLLNLTPDHLARHGSMDAYAHAKGAVFAQQGARDVAIYAAEDGWASRLALSAASRPLPFGPADPGRDGAWLEAGAVVLRLQGQVERYPTTGFAPIGRHNLLNLAVALLCCRSVGVAAAELAPAIATLRGLPHRMEPCGEVDGVRYINDSKATNVDSVVISLRALPGRTVLLLGGKDKGAPYAPLRGLLQQVHTIVCFGAGAERIERELTGAGPALRRAAGLTEALHLARQEAVEGDTVLLSPACSSFDEFDNFEQRGEVFSALVQQLSQGA